VTRLVGTCPVCERHQKVTAHGAMVHHGFKRPGWGAIVGDCFGVGYPAYELSPKGCEEYRDVLVTWRRSAEEQIRRYEARPDEVSSYSSFSKKTNVYRRDSDDPRERGSYESQLSNLISQTRYSISEIDRARKRMVERIANWVLSPLTENDEEGLTPAKREERTARKTEKDAKRAEKERAQAEQQKKRNERLARKATTLLFFVDAFDRLAQTPPSKERDDYARDLLFEAAKKKYGVRYPWDLTYGPDDGYGNHAPGPWGFELLEHTSRALIELGVAEAGFRGRANPIQVFKSSGNKIKVPEPNGPAEEVLDTIARMAPP
jgi:hypothetical protein